MNTQKKAREYLQSKFVKDGVALISGNVWTQAIAFASYLIVARLFKPEEIGLYNIFYSYIEVLTIVSTLKYEMATVIARDDREAISVSRLALRLNTIVSLILVTVIPLGNIVFGDADFSKHSFIITMLIPPMVFFCGTTRVYASIYNRYKNFREIALSEVVGSSSGFLLKVLFGLPHLASTLLHGIGLPLGTVLGKGAANFNYLIGLKKLSLPRDISRKELKESAKRFKNFPLYTMPKELINSLSYNLPFIWLALYFDKAEVGLFALALTFTFRPVNIFNNAFEKLLYVRTAEKVRNRMPIGADIKRFVLYINALALPLFVVAFFFGDNIFSFLFGERWSGCGYYIRCLLPWVYIMLTSTSLMFLSNVFSRQRAEFCFYIVLLLMRIASMIIGIMSGDFKLAILLFAMSGAVISLSLLVWFIKLVTKYEAAIAEEK